MPGQTPLPFSRFYSNGMVPLDHLVFEVFSPSLPPLRFAKVDVDGG